MTKWREDKPTVPGHYLMRSMETDDEVEPVVIYRHKKGFLMVDDPHLGPTILDAYHDGLTNLEWKSRLRVVVAGSRDIVDKKLVFRLLDNSKFDIYQVVCGCAKGIDSLGREWAIKNRIRVKEFPAEWEKYGKRAGMLRNKEMVDYADAVICIWDGKSKGTLNTIEYTEKCNKPLEKHINAMERLW